MNNIFLLLLLSFLSFTAFAEHLHLSTHSCKHEKIEKLGILEPSSPSNFDSDDDNDIEEEIINERKLSPSPMRFNYDYSQLSDITSEQLIAIINAVDSAFTFYSSFLKPKNVLSDSFQVPECGDYSLSSSQKSKKWTNSDYIFYLRTKSDSSNWIASAAPCQLSNADNRPAVGYINFNRKFLESSYNTFTFKSLTQVVVHEIFHAIVLNSQLFPYYKGSYISGTSYDSGSTPRWVAFPNCLAWAKAQYGCPSLTKVYLEDDGGSGSAGSHWERTLLQNDIMTSSALAGDGVWSCLNNALLVDSGWYTVDTTFCETIYWGLNKGCNFVSQQCGITTTEFCDASSSLTGFYFTGFGKCTGSDDPFLDNSCKYVMIYSETVCYNPGNNSKSTVSQLVQAGSVFGWDSKSFTSSIKVQSVSFTSPFDSPSLAQCYQSSCSGSGGSQTINVKVGTSTVTCSTDGQTKTVVGYSGQLTCPTISDFCNKSINCSNHCNSGGICLNKNCYCAPGFSGTNCICGNGTYWNGSQCAQCTTQNCQKCSTSDACVFCQEGYILNGTICEEFGNLLTFNSLLIFLTLIYL